MRTNKITGTLIKTFHQGHPAEDVEPETSSGMGAELFRIKNKNNLKCNFSPDLIEAGCDEAGRGCLAGPVFAAAVILPKDYRNDLLDDSKKLNAKQRDYLRPLIERHALSWAVSSVSETEIDEINILQASFLAMHRALNALSIIPNILLIDGNRFTPYGGIRHQCIVKGDGIYMSIAAASILAKTYRDEFMCKLHNEYPVYNWISNKGYPSELHRERIMKYGSCPYHRKSFNLTRAYDESF